MIIIIKKVFQYKNQQKWVRFFHLNFDWHGMIIAQLPFLRIDAIYDKGLIANG